MMKYTLYWERIEANMKRKNELESFEKLIRMYDTFKDLGYHLAQAVNSKEEIVIYVIK